jgi:hypothetical protein
MLSFGAVVKGMTGYFDFLSLRPFRGKTANKHMHVFYTPPRFTH